MISLQGFPLYPWDRNRPRRRPPAPEAQIELGGQEFALRSANGILFFRDWRRPDAERTLALQDPLEPGQELEAAFTAGYGEGRVARYVLLPYGRDFTREFPLFFAADGTGFCRESWNRDDLPFLHELSMHEWLEAPASNLLPYAREVFRDQVAPQLQTLDWPPDRNWPLDFHGGSRGELSALVQAIVALEGNLCAGGRIIRVGCQAESPFARAGVYAVQCEAGQVETFFDESSSAANGQRLVLDWRLPTLKLTRRFWTLCDWAVDAITPTGIYWDIYERGFGRLTQNPEPRDFSFQFIVDKLPARQEALLQVRNWALQIWPEEQVEAVLADEAVQEFEVREEKPR